MGLYLIVAGDFVTTGGMDRANHALADYLARRGDEVHLVAHRASNDLLACPNVVLHLVPKPANSYFLAASLLDRAGRRWAKKVSARGGHVIVNGGNCQWGDVNWVHYVHAAYQPPPVGSLWRRIKARCSRQAFLRQERAALRRARVVIANSQRTRQDLVSRLGVPDWRVRVVYCGTDPSSFRPAVPEERAAARQELGWQQTRPVAAFVGALADHRKGFDTLFSAWADLCRDQTWDVDLAVIGASAESPVWRARAAAAGLSSRIRLLGFRQDVPRVLRACDMLAAPTRYEPFGLGVQEALYMGLPAIISRSAGVAEKCPKELREFLLPDAEDASDLARRLRRWRDKMDQWSATARAAADNLHGYTWDDMAECIARMTPEAP